MKSSSGTGINQVATWKIVLAIGLGALVTVLVSFIQSATTDYSSGDPSSIAGKQLGAVIGAPLLPWAIGYFLVFRNATKSIKWIAPAVLFAASALGFYFGQSIPT